MVSLGVKTHGRDSPRTRDVQGVSLGANRFARQQGAQLGGVKFEFDVKGQVTEMTAIYTVCLHTVQTVPWYR